MNILRLVPEKGGEVLSVDRDEALVGRDPSCDVHLRDASVSRHHAAIRRTETEWLIDDLNSGNGVLIDGVRTAHAVLAPGQTVQFGGLKFRVDIDRGDEGATVILGRAPVMAQTMIGPAPARPEPRNPPTLLIALAAIAGVAFLAFAAALFLYLRSGATTDRQDAATAAIRTTPATPSPLPKTEPEATPPPAATPTPTPVPGPRSALLITSDAAVQVSVNGRSAWPLAAGGVRRLDVAPGEHLVRFLSENGPREEVVRVKASEQAVVRFEAGADPAPSASVAETPSSKATPTPFASPSVLPIRR